MSFHLRAVTVVAAATLCISSLAGAQVRGPGQARANSAVAPKVVIAPSSNAAALAQALAGTGVTISNATLQGATGAAGTFSGAAAGLGLDTGVVLSTGNVASVAGPNQSGDTSTNFGLGGDTRLDVLAAPNRTFDAVYLEFDLTTAQSTIGVRFVFASEEYSEIAGSAFSDVVAIFVNGVNCANINGRPVGVNSINAELNPALFVDNTGGTRDTGMDGMTVPLECVAAVTPNVRNRVRIAIADVVDGSLDSAIFLAAGGVHAPGNGVPTTTYVARAIEFHHPGFNHYFVTAVSQEIGLLDDGTFDGWFRTGLEFNVFASGAPDSVPVCRFFSTAFGARSSHFYTPNGPECVLVKGNADWQFEGDVFNVNLPAAGSGACPAGTQALYRLYNDGENGAPSHRYTVDLQTRELMLANGWTPEGEGIGVFACVP
ncbi:MAG: choice-of-anchor L domain-containing protein [Betaproteobacteria bacterium]|nr:choice-of-anchor L domain-containing protein [Betaproteobacteria bacterium]